MCVRIVHFVFAAFVRIHVEGGVAAAVQSFILRQGEVVPFTAQTLTEKVCT